MKEEKNKHTTQLLHLSIFVTESDDNRNSANDKIAASDGNWRLLHSRLYILLHHLGISTSPRHPPLPVLLLSPDSPALSPCLRFDNTRTKRWLACFVFI